MSKRAASPPRRPRDPLARASRMDFKPALKLRWRERRVEVAPLPDPESKPKD